MKSIKHRVTKLENRVGVNMAVIVILPGETEEQAREKYLAANPKCKGTKEELIIKIKFIAPLPLR